MFDLGWFTAALLTATLTGVLAFVILGVLIAMDPEARPEGDLSSPGLVTRICMYCKRVLRSDGAGRQSWIVAKQPPTDSGPADASHGICPDCYAGVLQPAIDARKAKLLDPERPQAASTSQGETK